ncbi:response regulator [Spartinivicinus poritis]|uniref:Response regulator n=1 Tax=Spartinivicinus poritis TaxID=2994640 RepID=A0ABT5U8Y6_9GAMM|nr:response regulator [Spartinivicinus sp. A2-2]MDE1461908.1 response regulator [Spartinivicinus sp. A2-2]
MNSIKILLIEDNPGDVELTREVLEDGRLKNDLQVAMDGEEALDYLFQRGNHENASTPDIILLDLNLPKVSGREVLQVIKKCPERSRIPVIVLSSSEAARDIQESYCLHANCFVTKPVKFEEFLKVVQMIESFWIDIVKLPSQCV